MLLNWFTSFFLNKAHTSVQAHQKSNRTLRFPQKLSPSAETIPISSCCRAGFAASLMRNNTFPVALLYQPCQNKLTRPCVILLLWRTERGSTGFFFVRLFLQNNPKSIISCLKCSMGTNNVFLIGFNQGTLRSLCSASWCVCIKLITDSHCSRTQQRL